MKSFSKVRVGTMIWHSTATKPKELSPKSHNRSKDENISQKSNYYEDDLYPQIALHNYAPLRVNSNWAVNLSQLCATHLNTGSHMLSNVTTWGRMQYFFKSCLAIVTTGLCSVSLMRTHWPLVSQNKTNAMLRNNYDALVYITNG
jgi:hypothetical protein